LGAPTAASAFFEAGDLTPLLRFAALNRSALPGRTRGGLKPAPAGPAYSPRRNKLRAPLKAEPERNPHCAPAAGSIQMLRADPGEGAGGAKLWTKQAQATRNRILHIRSERGSAVQGHSFRERTVVDQRAKEAPRPAQQETAAPGSARPKARIAYPILQRKPLRLSEVPALLRNPVGRKRLRRTILALAWPIVSRLAILYRRTLARKTRVVAVVGSFGKGSACSALRATLHSPARFHPDVNFGAALALRVLNIRPGERYAVIEVGVSRPGQMALFSKVIRPDVVVATCIGSEHNTSFQTLETTRHEKAEMLRALPPSGLAVLNGDDPNTRWMASQTRARVLTYGFGESNDVRASDARIEWPQGTRFTLHASGQRREMRIGLLGWPMVYSALAAAAVGLAEGLDLEAIAAALESLKPRHGRLEPVALANGAMLLCDEYKGPLETVDAALDVFGEIPAKRRIIVMGEVSELAEKTGDTYRRLGERMAQLAQKIIFVGRRKVLSAFRRGAARGGLGPGAIVHVRRGIRPAVEALQNDLGPGDVVLIKGRSSQSLSRIRLALAGRTVRCELEECTTNQVSCDTCPMLERGWEGKKVAM